MLQEFLSTNREALIARCRSKAGLRRKPEAADHELWYGVPLFLDQLVETLGREGGSGPSGADTPAVIAPSDIGRTAAQHGNELLRTGVTVDQVVHDYGDVCQAVTEMAVEQKVAVTVDEFRTLNRCLDEAIVNAVSEFGRQRDQLTADESTRTTNERLGYLAHELRNLIGNAILAFTAIKKGHVGATGSTGAMLDRSLTGLRDLIERTLVEVRSTAGIPERRERIGLAGFIADVRVAAAIAASARDLELVVAPVEADLAVEGDRQILAGALDNLLQNAVKFTRPRSRVSITASARADRILIEVADECGGLAEGKSEAIFRPFEQGSDDRTGLGLGLPVSRRGVEANGGKLYMRNVPDSGCVFTVDLPRAAPLSPRPGRGALDEAR